MHLDRTARVLIAGIVLAVSAVGAAAQDAPWRQGEPYSPRGNGEVYRPPGPANGPYGSQYGSQTGSQYGAQAGNQYGSQYPSQYGQQAAPYARGSYDSADAYRAPPQSGYASPPPQGYAPPPSDSYAYRGQPPAYGGNDAYRPSGPGYADANRGAPPPSYGEPYRPPPGYGPPGEPYDRGPDARTADRGWDEPASDSFSKSEIIDTGHRFFGSVSQGLANVVEYAFKQQGRPNGYILGEDAGGAFVAGLRYGEGTLFTKDAGNHKVYWQGPSLGYDFGAEGSKVMVLVYNLRDPRDIYDRFGGVQGSAYFVGGVGIQFQKAGDVTLAPIRSGLGLRLGANIGYLKYTRTPTWNPF